MIDTARYLLSISYDGSEYSGMVKQPNRKTIQGQMEQSFYLAFNHQVNIKVAGRSDAGVHAYDQKIEISTSIAEGKLVSFWNRSLPKSILIKDCQKIKEKDFHVRFSVYEKTYLYKLVFINQQSPFLARYFTYIKKPFLMDIFKEALRIFIGKHDYESVCTKENEVPSTYREIKKIIVREHKNEIFVQFIGKSFLRHMIRKIMGSAIACANGEISISELKQAFQSRIKIKYKSDPAGLYLERIVY